MTLKEQYNLASIYAMMPMLFIMLTMLFGFMHLDLHHKQYTYENFSVAIWIPIGAIACYILNIYGNLGSVLAAGIVGTLASFLPTISKESAYLKKLPATIYCGTFVGMSSVAVVPSISFAMAAGILAGVLFMLSKNLFLGIGGKLGTIAFGGVAMVSLIYWVAK
ncbi:MAG: hypothetical protein ACPG5B_06090 [Chitinophagales bacterium]